MQTTNEAAIAKGKTVKIPNAQHPILITQTVGRVIVKVGGEVVVESRAALTLKEADYPAVQYIPRTDVKAGALVKTEHGTYCPYKGDCSYFTVSANGTTLENAVWSYENPYTDVAQIKDYVAFYANKVDSITVMND